LFWSSASQSSGRGRFLETLIIGRFSPWPVGSRLIIVVPAHTPHECRPDPLESIHIHESGEFITEWLE
jgi:hypothetical protein